MANKDFDSWMLRTVKKYEAEHPELALKVNKTITQELKDCDYCNGMAVYYIPFSDNLVYLENGKMHIKCDCSRKIDIQINFCPMCGRKYEPTRR